MSDPVIRSFARHDRDQVASLVNAHAAAVVPNTSVSVAMLLNQLEHEPGEFLEDPWVTERVTLVAEQRRRVVAAAHLQRYSTSEETPAGLRGLGAIRWLLFWPDAPFWPDSARAGELMIETCLNVQKRWGVVRTSADGTLPVPGVYGVPRQWPHVLAALEKAGFASAGRTETIWLAMVAELPGRHEPPLYGMTVHRTIGSCGTRLNAELDGDILGYVELDTTIDAGSQRPRHSGIADIGNLWVEPLYRRRGIGSWLLAEGARWLELGGTTRLLAYTGREDDGEAPFLTRHGFEQLTETVRDLTLDA